MKDKFNGDLDKLNEEWWTAFWSHRYTSWDQIEPGDYSIHGLQLEWKRFITYQTIDFMKNEIAPLKEISPNIPVTTNLQKWWYLDHYELGKYIDVASWDAYPNWHKPQCQSEVAADAGFWHDYYRGIKSKPFLLMENTPSLVNWHSYNKLKRPGMNRLSSLQAIAHGSDSVQYFQFRKSRGSSEKFHGAVVDHLGNEHNRVFREIAELGKSLKKLKAVAGTNVKADVAIMVDSSNKWALDQCSGYQMNDKKYYETVIKMYKAFWNMGINIDIVFPKSDLSKYKLVMAPMLYMVTQELIEKLATYVENGGTLLSGYITGIVNENDLCYLGGFPAGKLKDVFGIWAEETDTLYPDEKITVTADGKEYDALDYCEIVHPSTAEVLAVYKEDFYKGFPAACKNKYGNGTAYYVAFRDTGDYTNALCEKLAEELGITKNAYGLTEGVTAHSREGDGDFFLFLENYNPEEHTVTVKGDYFDAESGEAVGQNITLESFGCKVLYKKI